MTGILAPLAGGAGAVVRFIVDSEIAARHRRPYPIGTLLINITGSFLLAILTAVVVRWAPGQIELKTVVGTGFLGGFTTFSTASVEAVRLWRATRPLTALVLTVSMLLCSIAAAAAGWAVVM
nr:CrcB family protein [Austwickia sp. TVS 96-490-7B]